MFRNMFSGRLSGGLLLLCFELCVGNKLDSIWSSNLDCSTSSLNPCDVLQNICGPSGVCVASGCSYNCMCSDGNTGSNCDSTPPASSGGTGGSEPTTSTGTVNEKRLPDIFGNGTLNYLVNLLKVETTSQSTTTSVATTVTVLSPDVSSARPETVSETTVVANEKTTVVPIPAAVISSTDTKNVTIPQDHVMGIAAPLISKLLTTATARPSSIAVDTTTKTTSSVPEVVNRQVTTVTTPVTHIATTYAKTSVVTAASATKTSVNNERPAFITKTVSAVSDNSTPTTISTLNVLQDSQSVQTTAAVPEALMTTQRVHLKSAVQTTTANSEASETTVRRKAPATETSPKATNNLQVAITTSNTVVTVQSTVPATIDTETPLPTTISATQRKTSTDAATSETKTTKIIIEMPKTSHDSTTTAPINTPDVSPTRQPSETTFQQTKTTERGVTREIVTRHLPADSQMQSTTKAQLTTPSPTPLVTIESAQLTTPPPFPLVTIESTRQEPLRTTIQTNAESTTSNPKEVKDALLVSGAAATKSKSERTNAKYLPKDNPEIPLTKGNPLPEDSKKMAKAGGSPTESNFFITTAPPASVNTRNNAEFPRESLTSVNNENLLINEKSPTSAAGANPDQVNTNTIPHDMPQNNDNTLSDANNVDNRAFSKGYRSHEGQVLKDLFQDLPVIPTASLAKSSKVLNPKIEASKISVTADKPEQLETVHDVQNINIRPFRNSVTPKTTEQQRIIQGTQHINNELLRNSVTPKTTEQQQTTQGTQNMNNDRLRTSVTPKTIEQQQTVQSTQNINIAISEKPVPETTTDDNSNENDDDSLPTYEKTTPAPSDDDDNETLTTPSSTLETTTKKKRNKREAKAFLQYLFRGAFVR